MLNRAEMLNRRASQPQFKAQEIIGIIAPGRGAVVADIGSGGGYFTMLFAQEVGLDGRVYTVDTNKKMLDYIAECATRNQMTNIETVLVEENGLNLPKNGCDLIFLRNAFHHIEDPEKYFKNLKRYLKPGGRVVVIDYKKRKTINFIALMGHHVEESVIKRTIISAGYDLIDRHEFLPIQSFSVYQVHK